MNFKEQAFNEYNSEEFAIRPGGIKGRGFWNVNSTQFIFAPCFGFPIIPKANGYLFTATDINGKIHTFKAERPTANLAPIWKDIPTGMVELKVESLDKDEKPQYLAGARTFYRVAPFKGPDFYPPKANYCTKTHL